MPFFRFSALLRYSFIALHPSCHFSKSPFSPSFPFFGIPSFTPTATSMTAKVISYAVIPSFVLLFFHKSYPSAATVTAACATFCAVRPKPLPAIAPDTNPVTADSTNPSFQSFPSIIFCAMVVPIPIAAETAPAAMICQNSPSSSFLNIGLLSQYRYRFFPLNSALIIRLILASAEIILLTSGS